MDSSDSKVNSTPTKKDAVPRVSVFEALQGQDAILTVLRSDMTSNRKVERLSAMRDSQGCEQYPLTSEMKSCLERMLNSNAAPKTPIQASRLLHAFKYPTRG